LDHQDQIALVITFARFATQNGQEAAHHWAEARPPK
jgi:hypothetical protein